jgi:transcriptional regulator with XRE-family HTH domain
MSKKKELEKMDPTEELINFGHRLKQTRQELKMLQKDFALRLGVPGNFLKELENGKTSPGFELLRKLYTTYNINLHYLIDGEGEAFMKDDLSTPPQTDEQKTEKDLTKSLMYYLEVAPKVRNFLLAQFSEYLEKHDEQVEKEVKKP